MAASITAHLQIFKRPQLPHFLTDFDETGIKIHGLLRSFILNIVIIRVAVPFNLSSWCLVMVERLFLEVPRGCLQFVIVLFPDHTHLLFFIL